MFGHIAATCPIPLHLKHWMGPLSPPSCPPAAGFGLAKPGERPPGCFAGCFQLPPPLPPFLLFPAYGLSTPRSSRGNSFAERSPKDTQKRPTASSLNALVSAPGAKRPEVHMRPQRQMHNLSAPRSNTELRAPKTAGIRVNRDAPAASP